MVNSMEKALGKEVDLLTQEALDNSKSKADFLFRNNVERDRVVLMPE